MKTLLLIAVVFFSTSTNAQSLDSTTTGKLNEITLHLDKCHRQHTTGVIFSMIGLVATGISLSAGTRGDDGIKNNKDNDNLVNIIGWGGGIMMLAGTIITIDSHKHIGRAGKVRF